MAAPVLKPVLVYRVSALGQEPSVSAFSALTCEFLSSSFPFCFEASESRGRRNVGDDLPDFPLSLFFQ